jgi:hypothetical protein
METYDSFHSDAKDESSSGDEKDESSSQIDWIHQIFVHPMDSMAAAQDPPTAANVQTDHTASLSNAVVKGLVLT